MDLGTLSVGLTDEEDRFPLGKVSLGDIGHSGSKEFSDTWNLEEGCFLKELGLCWVESWRMVTGAGIGQFSQVRKKTTLALDFENGTEGISSVKNAAPQIER